MKRILTVFLLCATLVSLGSCAKTPGEAFETIPKTGTTTISQISENQDDQTPEAGAETYAGPYSALTGLPCSEEDASLRPVAFTINNEIEYLPQGGLYTVGLSQADVIFETNIEANGSGTRLFPLFSQSALKNTPRVGTVRSARPYFINLALMADAYLCYDGASSSDDARDKNGNVLPAKEYARWMLHNSGVDALSVYTGAYGKMDADLKDKIGTHDRYNTLCALGEPVLKALTDRYPEKAYDDVLRRTLFSFGENELENKPSASRIKVIYADWNRNYTACDFVYDPNTRLYEKGQYVYKNMKTRTVVRDADNGKTLQFTNVFVLYTNQYAYDYRLSEGELLGPYHIKVDLIGASGEGYYFTNGKYEKITWRGPDDTKSVIRYYSSSGAELTVNPGKTYISLVNKNVSDNPEIS